MSNAKAKLNGDKIFLPLNYSQGGIRIADKNGNHAPSPTKAKRNKENFIEWMITNKEIKILSKLLDEENIKDLIKKLNQIKSFAEESEFSKRTTSSTEEKIATFKEFTIYQYMDVFNSFEKILESKLKVRLTFKLGDYGVTSHPHMYVLIPFDYNNLVVKNIEGKVEENQRLGSGCFAELKLNKKEIKEVVLALAHSSINHRNDLINILSR